MKRAPLRIPVALAWTAIAGGGLAAALSCSNKSPVESTTYCVGVVDGSLQVVDVDAAAGCPDGDVPQQTIVT
jgi:hypothetical protein